MKLRKTASVALRHLLFLVFFLLISSNTIYVFAQELTQPVEPPPLEPTPTETLLPATSTDTAIPSPTNTEMAASTSTQTTIPVETATSTGAVPTAPIEAATSTEAATITAVLPETPTETATGAPPVASSTLALSPEPPLNLLFSDTFDSGQLTNWRHDGSWTVVTTEVGAAAQVVNSTANLSPFATSTSLFNAAVEVRYRTTTGTLNLVMSQSSAGSYRLSVHPTGAVQLLRGDQVVALGTANVLPGQWHTVRFSVLGNTLRISINGVELTNFIESASLPPGDVALFSIFPPLEQNTSVEQNVLQIDYVQLLILETMPTPSPFPTATTDVIFGTLPPPPTTVEVVPLSDATEQVAAPILSNTTSDETQLELLYSQDFDDAQSYLEDFTGEHDLLYSRQGRYGLNIFLNNSPFQFNEPVPMDVVVQTRLAIRDGLARVNLREVENLSYSVTVSKTGEVVLYRGTNELGRTTVQVTHETLELRVEAIGEQLAIYVDQQEVLNVVDEAPLPAGIFSLSVVNPTQDGVRFDDLLIWTPVAQELSASAASVYDPARFPTTSALYQHVFRTPFEAWFASDGVQRYISYGSYNGTNSFSGTLPVPPGYEFLGALTSSDDGRYIATRCRNDGNTEVFEGICLYDVLLNQVTDVLRDNIPFLPDNYFGVTPERFLFPLFAHARNELVVHNSAYNGRFAERVIINMNDGSLTRIAQPECTFSFSGSTVGRFLLSGDFIYCTTGKIGELTVRNVETNQTQLVDVNAECGTIRDIDSTRYNNITYIAIVSTCGFGRGLHIAQFSGSTLLRSDEVYRMGAFNDLLLNPSGDIVLFNHGSNGYTGVVTRTPLGDYEVDILPYRLYGSARSEWGRLALLSVQATATAAVQQTAQAQGTPSTPAATTTVSFATLEPTSFLFPTSTPSPIPLTQTAIAAITQTATAGLDGVQCGPPGQPWWRNQRRHSMNRRFAGQQRPRFSQHDYPGVPWPSSSGTLSVESHHGVASAYFSGIFGSLYDENAAPTILMPTERHREITRVFLRWWRNTPISWIATRLSWADMVSHAELELNEPRANVPQACKDTYWNQLAEELRRMVCETLWQAIVTNAAPSLIQIQQMYQWLAARPAISATPCMNYRNASGDVGQQITDYARSLGY